MSSPIIRYVCLKQLLFRAKLIVWEFQPCCCKTGFASRTCLASQEWSEVDVVSCLSVAGQEYLAQAESLDGGQSLSFSQLKLIAGQLQEFTNEQGQATELFGGDVQVAGRVLNGLLRQLQGYATSEGAERNEIAALYEVSTQNLYLNSTAIVNLIYTCIPYSGKFSYGANFHIICAFCVRK